MRIYTCKERNKVPHISCELKYRTKWTIKKRYPYGEKK